MYRGDAGQLWRITSDLCVQSELVDHCDCELSEDGDCCFDGYGMLARHVGPVGMKSIYRDNRDLKPPQHYFFQQ